REGSVNMVSGTAFSPDGRMLAATYSDGAIRMWDTATGQPLRKIQGYAAFAGAVTFHPDGRRLVTHGSDKAVKVWDPMSGQLLLSLPSETLQINTNLLHMNYSDDGYRLFLSWAGGTWGKGGGQVWDGTPMEHATGPSVATLRGSFRGVAFSPDGR